MAQPAQDLTAAVGITQLSGRPVAEVADATLKAGASLLAEWEQLRPLVTTLRTRLETEVSRVELALPDAAKLLSTCATVVQKVGAASTGVLRASEGMAKLALLLQAGQVQRLRPAEMTQKQLIQTVVETVKSLRDATQPCPVCHAQPAVEVAATEV